MTKKTKTPTKISEPIPDDKNFNKGSEFGGSLISKSLQKFGAGRSILLDKNNRIIAGNKTVENAGAVGIEDVQVVETDGKTIIAVKRTDIDLDTPQGRELALADNASAKANIVFDAELIEAEVGEAVAEEWGIEPVKKEVEEDNFEAATPLNPITVLGDVYELNQHRFTCGSSTDADVVKKTLDGVKPVLMVTDPPYGVKYDPTWRHAAGIINSRRQGKVQNDDKASWVEVYSLFPGEVTYVWHGGRHAKTVAEDLEKAGFDIVCQIVWNKQQIVLSRGDYHWKHEPCWYAVKKGKKHNWNGDRKQSTVWDITSILQSSKKVADDAALVHGTQKPIECMARPIRNNTFERESVYDPFLGSGTTLIASDQLNRSCYGQEIDPSYCDIIVARFIKYKRSQSSATETFTVKRNGKLLSEEELQKYLAQIEPTA